MASAVTFEQEVLLGAAVRKVLTLLLCLRMSLSPVPLVAALRLCGTLLAESHGVLGSYDVDVRIGGAWPLGLKDAGEVLEALGREAGGKAVRDAVVEGSTGWADWFADRVVRAAAGAPADAGGGGPRSSGGPPPPLGSAQFRRVVEQLVECLSRFPGPADRTFHAYAFARKLTLATTGGGGGGGGPAGSSAGAGAGAAKKRGVGGSGGGNGSGGMLVNAGLLAQLERDLLAQANERHRQRAAAAQRSAAAAAASRAATAAEAAAAAATAVTAAATTETAAAAKRKTMAATPQPQLPPRMQQQRHPPSPPSSTLLPSSWRRAAPPAARRPPPVGPEGVEGDFSGYF